MCRRFIPALFWVACILSTLAFANSVLQAFGSRPRVSEFEGHWDGFFLSSDGTLGGLQSDVVETEARRIASNGVFFDLQNGGLFNTCNFNAAVPRAGFVTGTGVTQTGRLVFQADLGPFGGVGDNSVMAPDFQLVPKKGPGVRAGALLLRSQTGFSRPNIAGSYYGTFASQKDPLTGAPGDPGFAGFGRLDVFQANDRGYFSGHFNLYLHPDGPPLLSWPFLATSTDDQHVYGIAHGRVGRIVYDGTLSPAGEFGPRLDGLFRINFNSGGTLYNAMNVQMNFLQ